MSHFATACELRDAFRAGDRSARDICQDALDRIAASDHAINAFNTVAAERALERADAPRSRSRRWRDRPLAGVPVALKDNICTRGLRTTASSKILETFVPPYDATVVTRLEAAGAIVVGKTNCDEFAMGSSTENSAFGPTSNPWALDRIPGGSSGGSAVAVAAGMAPLALGSDTGGSIRQPAALCGVVGLKPTYGRVSRYGLLAFGSSLDQIGPFAHTVADAAIALVGHRRTWTRHDATSAADDVPDYAAALSGDVRGPSDRRPGERWWTARESTTRSGGGFQPALDALRRPWRVARRHRAPARERRDSGLLPCRDRRSELESGALRRRALRLARRGRTRRRSRSHDDLNRMYARTREAGFGPEVKRRIMLGTYVLSAGYYDAYYLKAQQVRTLIRRDYERAFERVDVVAMPTSPTPAFRLGERVVGPAPDVSGGRLHGERQPRGTPGHQRAVRLHRRRSARSACS